MCFKTINQQLIFGQLDEGFDNDPSDEPVPEVGLMTSQVIREKKDEMNQSPVRLT